jgi:integrase
VGKTVGKGIHKLTSIQINRASEGFIADGGGLYISVHSKERKSWIFRYTFGGKRKEMGLGPYPAVSIADARQKAAELRKKAVAARQGEVDDPMQVKKSSPPRGVTFIECAAQYIEAHRHGWKNAKHLEQWHATIKAYVTPIFGDLSIDKITTDHVLQVLKPIWHTKTETATRVRARIEVILDYAKAHGHFSGENPARMRGHLDKLLPNPSKIKKVVSHASMPSADLPVFFKSLIEHNSPSSYALAFTILSACRTSEVLNARWDEFDLVNMIWTIPPERMKAARLHRVPLTTTMIQILDLMYSHKQNDYVFFGQKKGRPLSNLAMLMLMRRMNLGHFTVHGFRSTFKDWSMESTDFANEVSEMALAHAISNKTEAAYRRGDLLEKRRLLMQAWDDFINEKAQG